MTLALHERGLFTWPEWAAGARRRRSAARRHAGDRDDGSTYYRHWLAAIERLVSDKGIASPRDAGGPQGRMGPAPPMRRRMGIRSFSRTTRFIEPEPRSCGVLRWSGRPRLGPLPRFVGAFLEMRFPVDHLQVGQPPIGEKLRPRRRALVAPDPEQRNAMIDLRVPQQPSPCGGASMPLDAFEQAVLLARRVPEFPRGDAGSVPARPRVRRPVSTDDSYAGHSDRRVGHRRSMNRRPREPGFPVGKRGRSERLRHAVQSLEPDAPAPSRRGAAFCGERSRQAVGAQGVRLPISLNGLARRVGDKIKMKACVHTAFGKAARRQEKQPLDPALVLQPEPFRLVLLSGSHA